MERLRARFLRPKILRSVVVCLALAAVGWPVGSGAEIYRWTDESGRLHFSQDIEKVPPAQRERAKRDAGRERRHDPLQIYGDPSARSAFESGSPPAARASLRGRGTMRIPFERHGTLMRVEVMLNGRVKAPFFIDTGASGVSIPWAVAQQLGLQITDDTPRIRVMTANGMVSEPVVQLKSVQLGPARVENLRAAVSGSMNIGLLGGAFFNNYVYQVDAAAGVITLRENANVRGGMGPQQWRERFDKIREPLTRLEAYLEQGGLTDEGRVRELESHRQDLRAALEQLEREPNDAGVPRGWRQ